MDIINRLFNRDEAIKLSRLTSGKLNYLEQIGMLVAEKVGNTNRPPCFYTWEQIVELRMIYKLREDASLQQLRVAKKHLRELGESTSLVDKTLVAANNRIYLIKNKPGELEKLVILLNGKSRGQLVINSIFQITDVIDEIWDIAKEESKRSSVIDFASFADRANHKHSKERKVV